MESGSLHKLNVYAIQKRAEGYARCLLVELGRVKASTSIDSTSKTLQVGTCPTSTDKQYNLQVLQEGSG